MAGALDAEWYWRTVLRHYREIQTLAGEHGDASTAKIYRQSAESVEQWLGELKERSGSSPGQQQPNG